MFRKFNTSSKKEVKIIKTQFFDEEQQKNTRIVY